AVSVRLSSYREPGHYLYTRNGDPSRFRNPPAELGDARRRMPAPRLRGHGFRDDPPQRVEIDDPVDLAAEGRRPGGEEHGILEGRAEEADGKRRGGGRAHGASSVGPRRPGTGGLTVAATASEGERNSKPSARARESSAAAYAGLASPRTASVYGEVGYRLDSRATKESWDWGSSPAAATSALGAKSELGASVTMRRNSHPASGALPSESRASSAARNSAASPLASSTSTRRTVPWKASASASSGPPGPDCSSPLRRRATAASPSRRSGPLAAPRPRPLRLDEPSPSQRVEPRRHFARASRGGEQARAGESRRRVLRASQPLQRRRHVAPHYRRPAGEVGGARAPAAIARLERHHERALGSRRVARIEGALRQHQGGPLPQGPVRSALQHAAQRRLGHVAGADTRQGLALKGERLVHQGAARMTGGRRFRLHGGARPGRRGVARPALRFQRTGLVRDLPGAPHGVGRGARARGGEREDELRQPSAHRPPAGARTASLRSNSSK